jgi:hypothetical protein
LTSKISLSPIGRRLVLAISVFVSALSFDAVLVCAQEGPGEAESQPPPAVEPPHLSLYGTILYSDAAQARAILRLEGSDRTVSVGLGDDVRGWTVVQIAPRQVMLSLEDHSAAFVLNDFVHPGDTPTIAQRKDKQNVEGPVVHHRAPRVFEMSATGVWRSHRVKIARERDGE